MSKRPTTKLKDKTKTKTFFEKGKERASLIITKERSRSSRKKNRIEMKK